MLLDSADEPAGLLPAPGEHGGDGPAVARALGMTDGQLIDLSVSLNPFAPDFTTVFRRAVERGVMSAYPDETRARAALAEAIGTGAERLVLTNGGAEAISIVAGMLGRGWVEQPEFSLYARSIPVLDPKGPLFRSNPHNPTGKLAAAGEVAGVWDEAFFALATGKWTRGDADGRHPSIVVGSLTKVLGCPGLRAGYVLCPDEDLARAISRRRPQWALNSLAASCLPEMLEAADLARWARRISGARAELVAVLRSHGLEALPSEANWVLVRCGRQLRTLLASRGVLVRDCASFGLRGTFRVSVPDARGLELLDRALGRALGSGPAERVPDPPVVKVPGPPLEQASGSSVNQAPASAASSCRKTREDRASSDLRGGILVCGTGSDVGKSAVVTGLCRLLARRGVRVAPFKAQNMALNSWVTDDGAEIGRAQGVQAIAAGVPAEAAMNPVLLKPTSDRRSQVVVLGEPWAEMDASTYHGRKLDLLPVVRRSLDELRERFDVVVCEGAGSPAEINLLDHDIVNLRLAVDAGLPAIVVGDIERGGVLAALYGTVGLLPDELRAAVHGFVVNRFRGDPDILAPGLDELERRTGVRTLGVLRWMPGIGLDAEDSLALSRGDPAAFGRGDAQGLDARDSPELDANDPMRFERRDSDVLDVAVVRFPRISNFTDLDALALEPRIRLRMVEHPRALGDPDLVVLPGTKTTAVDLGWMRETGIADALLELLAGASRPVVFGICGGYQMLGRSISDPDGVESAPGKVDGLGWLPTETVFGARKVVRQRHGRLDPVGNPRLEASPVRGYEIHHGVTRSSDDSTKGNRVSSWIRLEDGRGDVHEGHADVDRGILGTSLHGLLECDEARGRLLGWVADRRAKRFEPSRVSFAAAREARIDRLADAMEQCLDLDELFAIIASASDDPHRTARL